jgi:hypothetical protein
MAQNKNVFNPVKEDKDGVKAKRVIWSSQALDLAIQGLLEGKRLVANPFYNNEVKLLKADLNFQRTEEEVKEWKRCRSDIFYFIENYCKIMTPEGVQKVKLRDYQNEYLEHLQKHRLSIFLAPRQCGKTVTSGLFMLHYICFNVDKSALVTGDKYKTAKEILNKVKEIYYELPYFLKPGICKWNESEVVLDNGCRMVCETTTAKTGIGFTYHCILADEFAKIDDSIKEKFYSHLFPAVTAAKARFMITSTQNGRELFYRIYTAAYQHLNEYGAFTIGWERIPEWNPDTRSWEKRDEAWHQKQVANYGSEEAFNLQFGTDFNIGANTLVSQKKLNSVNAIRFINKDIYGVSQHDSWFWHPDFDPMVDLKKSYIITTCDLAEGINQDYTVFSIFRMIDHGTDNLECIGYFRANTLHRELCARSLMELYIKYCHPDHSLISFERNTYGEIFLRDVNDLASKYFPQWEPSLFVKYYTENGSKFHYGVKVTSGNKTTNCVIFKESFERGKTINEAEQFIFELQNFSDDGSGHYKASFGHDDMVMTAVQLEFVRKELQYRLLRDDFEAGHAAQDDNIWNPYDTSNMQQYYMDDDVFSSNRKRLMM